MELKNNENQNIRTSIYLATIACAAIISVSYDTKAWLLAIGTMGFGMLSGALTVINTEDI